MILVDSRLMSVWKMHGDFCHVRRLVLTMSPCSCSDTLAVITVPLCSDALTFASHSIHMWNLCSVVFEHFSLQSNAASSAETSTAATPAEAYAGMDTTVPTPALAATPAASVEAAEPAQPDLAYIYVSALGMDVPLETLMANEDDIMVSLRLEGQGLGLLYF